MSKGYIKLWRKVLDNPVLHERGKRYSRMEAWIYLCLIARGTDDTDGILKRGEFCFSIRYLAKAWNWGRGVVERFLRDLQDGSNPMITRVGQQTGQFEGHFIICKYDTYNPRQDSKRDSKQDKYNDSINESINISAVAEDKMPRIEDAWYVIFRDLHQVKFDAPYQCQQADFVKLAALKKSLKNNGQIPASWKETCQHYLDTPQGKLTLADLCVRYAIFKRSSLDQFNKPVVPFKFPEQPKPTYRIDWQIIEGKRLR